MEPISLAASITSLVVGCTKIVKLTNDVRQKYKNASLTIASIAAECGTVSVALSQLQWLALSRANSQLGSANGGLEQILHSFEAVILGCTLTLSVIEEYTLELLSNDPGASPFDAGPLSRLAKAKFVWNEDEMKELLQQLRGHQSSLTLLLTVLQSQSDLQVQELLRNQGEALKTLAERAQRSRRRKPASFLSPRDSDSLFSSRDSTISNTAFDFDAELINTRAYRQVMQGQQRRNAGYTWTSLQPTVENAPDEETGTYVATADEVDKSEEPQSPPPPQRLPSGKPETATAPRETTLPRRDQRVSPPEGAAVPATTDPERPSRLPRQAQIAQTRPVEHADPIERPPSPPPCQRVTPYASSEATTLMGEQDLDAHAQPQNHGLANTSSEPPDNWITEQTVPGSRDGDLDMQLVNNWRKLLGINTDAFRSYLQNGDKVTNSFGPFEIICEPVYPGSGSDPQSTTTDAGATPTKTLEEQEEDRRRSIKGMTTRDRENAWVRCAKDGNLVLMESMRNIFMAPAGTSDIEGRSPLYWAAVNGHLDVVKFLQNHGFTGSDSEATLIETAKRGHHEILQLLCKDDILIHWRDDFERTALHWAAFGGHTAAVRVLLEAGAQVGQLDKNGIRPLYLTIAHGHKETVKRFLEAGDGILPAGAGLDEGQPWDFRGMNALHIACQYGSVSMVDMLLEAGCSIYSRTGEASEGSEFVNETVMHIAVRSGELAMVEHLIAKGALVDAPNATNARPLLYAAKLGYADIARALLDNGADVHGQDNGGDTALHLTSSPVVTKLLLQRGANPDARDRRGETPLQLAVIRGKDAVVECLVPVTTDVNNISSGHGHTPLFCASYSMYNEGSWSNLLRPSNEQKNRFSRIISLLLSAGANIEATDNTGSTPLLYAVNLGQSLLVEIFLNEGANVNAEDNGHANALHNAIMRIKNHFGSDVKYRPLIRILLDHSVDVDAVDGELNTPLHYAARPGREGAAALLLKAGAIIGDGNSHGQRPLHIAALGGSHITARLLLDKGADPNARDKQGRTALHAAAEKGHAGVAILLCNRGVDITAKDKSGKTAMEVAEETGHRSVVSALKVKMGDARGGRS